MGGARGGRSDRAGRYRLHPEGYRAFLPKPLPPDPPLRIDPELQALLSHADQALGRLDGAVQIDLAAAGASSATSERPARFRPVPGEFRTDVVWIGSPGAPLNDATFVPLPPEAVPECMEELEVFCRAGTRYQLW